MIRSRVVHIVKNIFVYLRRKSTLSILNESNNKKEGQYQIGVRS